MESILKFTLPEESEELQAALNGQKYRAVLISLDSKLRHRVKYDGLNSIDVSEVRKMISEELEEYNLSIYD
jgi:hypothetical protein